MKSVQRRLVCASALMLGAVNVASGAWAQAAPQRGGTLIMPTPQAPRHLNAAVQSGVATMVPSSQLFASPLRYDDKWAPKPYLAEKWNLSADGKTLTLNLVKNAVFHDGKPVTSEDVAFSIMTIRNNHPFSTMLAPVEKVDTPDAHTAIIRMSKPHPAILLAMSPALCPIIPKHIYGDGQDVKNHPRNIKGVVGSGPFKLTEFVPGQYIAMERFDKFFIQGRPYLDKLIIKVAPDESANAIAAERGEYGMLTTTDPRITQRLVKAGLKDLGKGYEGIGAEAWIAVNLRKAPLNNVKLRQAISYALDRQFISKVLHGGTSEPLYGPIVSNSPFFDNTINPYKVDLARAEKLLDEAGFKKGADGNRVKLVMDFIPGSDPVSKVIAEYSKSQLKKVGIDIELRSSPDFPSWAKRIASGDFELTTDIVFNWGDPVIGVHRTYLSTNIKPIIWTNTQGYANAKVDEVLGQAAEQMDPVKRRAYYGVFQRIVNDELPVIWTTTVPFRTMVAKNIRNAPDSIWGPMSPFDEVWIEGKR